MHKKSNDQIGLSEFYILFWKLDAKNRLVKIANMNPVERYETKYAECFYPDNGAPVISFRMAIGTPIIKERAGHAGHHGKPLYALSNRASCVHGRATLCPARSITNFRKHITTETIDEINDEMFHASGTDARTDNNNNEDNGETKNNDNKNNNHNDPSNPTPPESDSESPEAPKPLKNPGALMHDAICAPANIKYPTDVNWLNEALEKLEAMIDALQTQGYYLPKTRTYRQKAR